MQSRRNAIPNEPSVFISCGQSTPAEKQLGKRISEMVKKLTGLEPFFAEDVQDLNGLDTNILNKLRDCIGFITVLHPRGEIRRPDGSTITRASVWIEQEIAIATYIQRVEKRELPVIVFKHASVDREGLRDLLHLNPIEFDYEADVLVALAERLMSWKSLVRSDIQLEIDSNARAPEDGHVLRNYRILLVNNSNRRIRQYTGEVYVTADLLKHRAAHYPSEIRRGDAKVRFFRFNEEGRGDLNPHDRVIAFGDEYCTTCAINQGGGDLVAASLASEAVIGAKGWIDGREYHIEKTVKQLALERS